MEWIRGKIFIDPQGRQLASTEIIPEAVGGAGNLVSFGPERSGFMLREAQKLEYVSSEDNGAGSRPGRMSGSVKSRCFV